LDLFSWYLQGRKSAGKEKTYYLWIHKITRRISTDVPEEDVAKGLPFDDSTLGLVGEIMNIKRSEKSPRMRYTRLITGIGGITSMTVTAPASTYLVYSRR
jgi:hypothetical protein